MQDRTVSTTWRRGNRVLRPGVEVSISGERGRFRFREHVVNTASGAEWVTVIGPSGFRSFRPERIKRVHNAAKLRPVSAKAARLAGVAA
jgi:hypothetical protein